MSAAGEPPGERFNVHGLTLRGVFHPSTDPSRDPPTMRALSFHRDGRLLVSADTASELMLVDVVEGRVTKRVSCRREPVGTVCFTHHEQSVLCSSKGCRQGPGEHDLRYVSLHDNSYLQLFRGHTGEVASVSMSPVNDMFLSSAADRTVRLWSLQEPRAVGQLQLPPGAEDPLVAFDPAGRVFATAYSSPRDATSFVKLYDARNYATGPFSTFVLEQGALGEFLSRQLPLATRAQTRAMMRERWTSMVFSPDGESMVVTSADGTHLQLDAFDGVWQHVLIDQRPPSNGEPADRPERPVPQVTYTPDGHHVVAGSVDGHVLFWDTDAKASTSPVRRAGGHVGPVTCVACSPKYEVLAIGCHALALWTP